jgi:pimeloyl-ACP methyl ester carboxylesterase
MAEEMIVTPNGRFAVRSTGAEDAPVVLLLHGFPDDASTF